jgi:hypothetical protein
MGIRHFVLVHRRPNIEPCPPVTCVVCEKPVGREGLTAFGDAVCSEGCVLSHPRASEPPRPSPFKDFLKAHRDVTDQLAALKRAEKLPDVYQRVRPLRAS